MKIRETAVAGSFYPRDKEKLEKQLNGFFKGVSANKKSRCVVAPHAGYIYSGRVAAISFKALQKAETFVVIGPNHTGLGERVSVSGSDFWETPSGNIAVDTRLREKVLGKMGIEADDLAHIQEHSLEVQLPFIQHLFPKAKVLPITLMTHAIEELEKLAAALHSQGKKKIAVIASSDFSHFIPEEKAKAVDREAIKLIEKMDYRNFHKMVEENQLSICGSPAIVTAMVFAQKEGYKKGRLLKYATSASVTKDRGNVVGYAAIRFE